MRITGWVIHLIVIIGEFFNYLVKKFLITQLLGNIRFRSIEICLLVFNIVKGWYGIIKYYLKYAVLQLKEINKKVLLFFCFCA